MSAAGGRPARVPILVLASGRGTGFAAIADAVATGGIHAEILAVLSDRADAGVLELARQRGIPAHVLKGPAPRADRDEAARLAAREAWDHEILTHAQPATGPRAKWLVMAGYMRVVTPALINAFRAPEGYSRIVNVHPALLPAFPGLAAYEQAFLHGCAVAGATIHLVEPEVDVGPICAQEAFGIADCRSAAEVEARGLAVEHRLYPKTLHWVLTERFNVEPMKGGRLRVRPS